MDWRRAATFAALSAGVSIVVSIAAFNILLGLAILLLLVSRQQWRMPPINLPLALFLLGTVLSLAFSAHPAQGMPQIKKFWVWLTLPVVYSAVRSIADLRYLVFGWTAAATAASIWSFVQFFRRVQEAHRLGRDLYSFYVAQRTTGFTGHWMTFGGVQMIVLMMLLAWLFYMPRRRETPWLWAAVVLMSAALLVSLDRGVWLACIVAGCWLLGMRRPKLLWAVPIALIGLFVAAPGLVRDRIVSIYKPHGQTDSNSHRYYTLRTGLAMIKAHPWLGLGPEQVGPQFDAYMPLDLPRQKPEGFYGHLHNIYLQYAAERGIPVLLCLLWMIGAAWRDFRVALRRAGQEARPYLAGAIAVILSVLVEGLLEHNLGDSEVLVSFLVVLAAGYIARTAAFSGEVPATSL